ncbi:MAG: FAD-dependent thymidylate synthase [Candidatus Kapabacteria bacterium]|jgi:thymidylate synthase (FAD)|nr:FAD-dependent thymidylate synthase [Candidatus Kapabacteria bacterium]
MEIPNSQKNSYEQKVLDHGFVRLVDYMGDDNAIVQAARVSYGAGTKNVSSDRQLIRYLMRHRHTTPFEMCEVKFHVKLPIFVARQWIRHRTANVNEISGRYSEMVDEFYVPELEQIRPQSVINKQGRSEDAFETDEATEIQAQLSETQRELYSEYKESLDKNLARELARINLPLSLYTEWYWKIDLHNLFHFLHLRLDAHAQYEIRVFAEAMAAITKELFPIAYEAFEDYRLNSIGFTGPEIKILQQLLSSKELSVEQLVELGLSKRESSEFVKKMSFIRSFPTK